jgi:hypothetical protein
MTRARFCLLALLVACGASRAVAQPTVAGDWDMTIVSPQGPNTTKVSFKQDGDKVTGMFKSQAGQLPLEGTMTGSDVKLAFTINFQGQPLPITLTGKLDGETMAGKADFGGFAEGDFSATRSVETTADAAPPAPAAPAVPPTPAAPATPPDPAMPSGSMPAPSANGAAGTWEVTLKTDGGDYPVSAMLTDDAGKISGTLSSQMGEVPVSGTMEGRALKLSLVAKTPQGDIPIVLTGDVAGDEIINGKADFGGMGQGEWTAKRKQ